MEQCGAIWSHVGSIAKGRERFDKNISSAHKQILKIAKTSDPWPIHVPQLCNFRKVIRKCPLQKIFDRGVLESVFTFDQHLSIKFQSVSA